jgi:hypothetical protein
VPCAAQWTGQLDGVVAKGAHGVVRIGVVGRGDLTRDVAAIVEAAGHSAVSAPGLSTTAALADHLAGEPAAADAWLFTSIHTYHQAEAAGLLDRPAAFVSYTAGALQQALITAFRDGVDIARLSVDTISEAAVRRAYAGAELRDLDGVQVLPFRANLATADYASFHRTHAGAGAALAVTCSVDVAEQLAGDIPVVLVHPVREVIGAAVDSLVVEVEEREAGLAQIAVGHIDADVPSLLAPFSRDFDGWLTTQPSTVLVSTRGGLERATQGFTAFPLVDDVGAVPGRLRVGFGIAFSAAEATRLADRALHRAQRLGERAVVVLGRYGTHLVHVADAAGDQGVEAPGGREGDLGALAVRAGLSVDNMHKVVDFAEAVNPMTASQLARHLDIQDRSARRILNQLDSAGLAVRSVNPAAGSSGRPAVSYLLAVGTAAERSEVAQ